MNELLTVKGICDINRANNFKHFKKYTHTDGGLQIASEEDETSKYINKLAKDSNLAEIEGLLNTIIEKYDINNGILWNDEDDYCLSFVKHTGSNGKECSIKSSLIEMSNLLEILENDVDIKPVQMTDVSIDNLDDVYDFAILITLGIK